MNTAPATLIIVSGLSGSGKSVTLRTLEDLGFYCVDNLPAKLLPSTVADIAADIEHGEKGYEIVEKYATTDDMKAACVRQVREATMMRRLYLDGVWRTFVEKQAEKKLAA